MLLCGFAAAGLFEYILCCGESVRGWNLSVYSVNGEFLSFSLKKAL
jgi:hypothetical protein